MTNKLAATLEALLIVADAPVPTERLAAVVERPAVEVTDALTSLAAGYVDVGRGFELRQGAQGWRLYSAPEFDDVIARFVLDGASARLSQAALETLAVIAYRQPVSRGAVSAVRGVNVDGVVRTLLARNLIAEVGTDPASGATLFGTTPEFLDRLGLTTLDALPPLAPHLPGAEDVPNFPDA
jgi:segregation and condensation protein B